MFRKEYIGCRVFVSIKRKSAFSKQAKIMLDCSDGTFQKQPCTTNLLDVFMEKYAILDLNSKKHTGSMVCSQ